MHVNPGYKQTEVGLIPDDWDAVHLGDTATKVGSGVTPTGGARVYKQGGRPFIRSQNIGWGNLLLDDIAYIDDETHAKFQNTEIEADDVFLNITGASIGRSAIADARVEKGNVNQHVCIIRTDQIVLHPRFLKYFLLSTTGQKQIDSFQAGGNRQGLNFGHIRSFRLPLPSTPEQHAIAEALSDADALIESLEQLLAKKRQIKKGAMQELLTGKKRLPGFSEEWKAKQLGQLGVFLKGSGVARDESATGNLACVRYGELYTRHNNHISAYYSWISREVATTATRLEHGDILFAGSGETKDEIGKCAAFVDDIEAYAGGDIVILRNKETDPLFLGYYLNTEPINRQKASNGQGDAIVHIGAEALADIQCTLPYPPEQRAIATVLSDMDAEIAALEAKLSKARLLKQGMMQELLTGRIRLL